MIGFGLLRDINGRFLTVDERRETGDRVVRLLKNDC